MIDFDVSAVVVIIRNLLSAYAIQIHNVLFKVSLYHPYESVGCQLMCNLNL